MPFYDQLTAATESARADFIGAPVVQRALSGNVSRVEYQTFLSQAYHHVKHTVPLLMACGTRLPERLAWLRDAVAQYIEEELGHEEWILDDIAAADGDPLLGREAPPARHRADGCLCLPRHRPGQSGRLLRHGLRAGGHERGPGVPGRRGHPRTPGTAAQRLSLPDLHGSVDQEHIRFLEACWTGLTTRPISTPSSIVLNVLPPLRRHLPFHFTAIVSARTHHEPHFKVLLSAAAMLGTTARLGRARGRLDQPFSISSTSGPTSTTSFPRASAPTPLRPWRTGGRPDRPLSGQRGAHGLEGHHPELSRRRGRRVQRAAPGRAGPGSAAAGREKDPDALHGSIYTSLGTLYAQVPGWPLGFGDNDNAKAYFNKALEVNPAGIDPNYFYAQFLYDQHHYNRPWPTSRRR